MEESQAKQFLNDQKTYLHDVDTVMALNDLWGVTIDRLEVFSTDSTGSIFIETENKFEDGSRVKVTYVTNKINDSLLRHYVKEL